MMIRMEMWLLRGCREVRVRRGWATYRRWERAESRWNKAASCGSEGVHTKRSYESARAPAPSAEGSLISRCSKLRRMSLLDVVTVTECL